MASLKIYGFVFACLILWGPSVRAGNLQTEWLAALDTGHGPLEFGLKLEGLKSDGDSNSAQALIINGLEKIPVKLVKDESSNQLILQFPHYDSQIVFGVANDEQTLSGVWLKRRGDDNTSQMKFSAKRLSGNQVQKRRELFEDPERFAGRWQVSFEGDAEKAVAEFKRIENSNQVTGTFLTTTGDYRYLAGHVENDRLQLSCFDGAHAFLFYATLDSGGEIEGIFCSGNWHKQSWTATRNPDAKLPDATRLTTTTDKTTLSAMKFPNLDGAETSLNELTQGKPAIVEVFGSWCPNCHDAAHYLTELYNDYRDDDLRIVGLAFELTSDFERNAVQVRRYVERHDVTYPVLIAGPADKQKATAEFKFLDRIRSYPTFIFVDRNGNVVSVYQGFSGPATGEAYEELKKTFKSTITKMIAD